MSDAIEPDWIISPIVDSDGNQAWKVFQKGQLVFTVTGSADDAWSRVDDFVNPIGPIKNAEGIDLASMGFQVKGKVR